MEILNLIVFVVLIVLTAFFVATEFAVIRVRSTRIDQLIAEGNKNAVAAKKVISNLDEYLSACQLGITVTALGLGWIGEPTVARLLEPLFEKFQIGDSLSHILSFIIAFSVVTYIHVVVGELAPKTLAIQKAEKVTLLCARPIILFYRILYPFIWALNGSARAITKLFGLKPVSENESAHSEEELRIILSESYESGEINQSEFNYVNNIFEFDDRTAREIMVPRNEMNSVSKDETIESFLNMAKTKKHTRYPVILEGDKDQIVGLVNIKEVFTDFVLIEDMREQTIESYVKPIIQVMDSIPIHHLLLRMQKDRIHMAVLIDEYGGTAGLVTAEDILEEIVGEIRDEFDTDELPSVQKVKNDHYILDAKVLIDEVNDLIGTDIEEEELNTIGGWILTQNFDIKQGQSIHFDSYEFKVLVMNDHHITRVEVFKIKQMSSLSKIVEVVQ